MVALFVVMIVPVSGWYFLGELTSRQLPGTRPGDAGAVAAVQDEIRFKLALTLGASVIVLGAVVVYLRRTLVDPLDRLARRARAAEAEGWRPPPESARQDEIGDLARALDRSIPAMETRADQALQFATNLSHELRTPLAAIRGAAEILAESRPEAADRKRFLDNIQIESERLERLVAGLLDLERREDAPGGDAQAADAQAAATRAAAEEVMAPGPVVRGVLARCAPLFERRFITADFEEAPPLPAIRMQQGRLERILFGLLENALKFSPRGGCITVRASSRDGDLFCCLLPAKAGC